LNRKALLRGVGAQGRIVVHRAEGQRRAAAPAAHHLGGQQFLVLGSRGVVAQMPAEGGDVLVQLAEAT
jgi:hypothetical protein